MPSNLSIATQLERLSTLDPGTAQGRADLLAVTMAENARLLRLLPEFSENGALFAYGLIRGSVNRLRDLQLISNAQCFALRGELDAAYRLYWPALFEHLNTPEATPDA
jgi:hypothetical protein